MHSQDELRGRGTPNKPCNSPARLEWSVPCPVLHHKFAEPLPVKWLSETLSSSGWKRERCNGRRSPHRTRIGFPRRSQNLIDPRGRSRRIGAGQSIPAAKRRRIAVEPRWKLRACGEPGTQAQVVSMAEIGNPLYLQCSTLSAAARIEDDWTIGTGAGQRNGRSHFAEMLSCLPMLARC
jgi:hypothetical protein